MIFVSWHIYDSFYNKKYQEGSLCAKGTVQEFAKWLIKTYGEKRSIQYDNLNTVKVQLHSKIELIITIEEITDFGDYQNIKYVLGNLILGEITIGGQING